MQGCYIHVYIYFFLLIIFPSSWQTQLVVAVSIFLPLSSQNQSLVYSASGHNEHTSVGGRLADMAVDLDIRKALISRKERPRSKPGWFVHTNLTG